MKNLVEKLKKEAGLTSDQARLSVSIFRDYLIESENDPDIVETMKVKAGHAASTAKSKAEELGHKAEDVIGRVSDTIVDVGDRASDKAEDLLHKAKQKVKGVADKISDYLEE